MSDLFSSDPPVLTDFLMNFLGELKILMDFFFCVCRELLISPLLGQKSHGCPVLPLLEEPASLEPTLGCSAGSSPWQFQFCRFFPPLLLLGGGMTQLSIVSMKKELWNPGVLFKFLYYFLTDHKSYIYLWGTM